MADVFISHSSIDKEVADKVCATLEAKGLTCWIAPRDIVPGSEWAVAISNAIAEIKAMVVIYSKNAEQSTQVPKEIALAEKRGKCILPYKIDDTELTGALYRTGTIQFAPGLAKNRRLGPCIYSFCFIGTHRCHHNGDWCGSLRKL